MPSSKSWLKVCKYWHSFNKHLFSECGSNNESRIKN